MSALHHLSPTRGIRFLRVRWGQKLIETQINYTEKRHALAPSEIPRPCSLLLGCFKNNYFLALHPLQLVMARGARWRRSFCCSGQSLQKSGSSPADRKGGKCTHISVPTPCTSQVAISFKLHTDQLKVLTEVCSCIHCRLVFQSACSLSCLLHTRACTCENSPFLVSLQQGPRYVLCAIDIKWAPCWLRLEKHKCDFLPTEVKSKKSTSKPEKNRQQYATTCPLRGVLSSVCWLISRDRHWWIKPNCFLCFCVTPFYLQDNLAYKRRLFLETSFQNVKYI